MICKDCKYSPGDNCPYCTVPFTRHTIQRASSNHYTHHRFPCIECSCNHGTLICSYEVSKMEGEPFVSKQCHSYSDCSEMMKNVDNGNDVDYKCQSCPYQGKLKAPLSRWNEYLDDTTVVCYCNNFGEIECKTEGTVMDISFQIYCEECIYAKMKEVFSSKGIKTNYLLLTIYIYNVSKNHYITKLQVTLHYNYNTVIIMYMVSNK